MTRNSRELSQFASFIDVRDANQNIGIITSIVIEPGGVGIGSTVADYRAEVAARGAVDPLINFNETYLLNDVYIEGNLNIDGGDSGSVTGFGATFPKLNVGGLTTTKNLVVTGFSSLGTGSGFGTVHIGINSVDIGTFALGSSESSYPGTIFKYIGVGGGNYVDDAFTARASLVINNYDTGLEDDVIALQVFGRSQFNGLGGVAGTAFVVVPESFFHNKITSAQGIDVTNLTKDLGGGASQASNPQLRVFNSSRARNLYLDNQQPDEFSPAIYTDGGLLVDQYGEVGLGFSVGERLEVGHKITIGGNGNPQGVEGQDAIHDIRGSIRIGGPEITLGYDSANHLYDGVTDAKIIFQNAKVASNFLPLDNQSLGDEFGYAWSRVYVTDLIDVGISNTENSEGGEAGGRINCKTFEAVGIGTLGELFVQGIPSGDALADTETIDFQVSPGLSSVKSLHADGKIQIIGITTIKGSLTVMTQDGGPFNGYAKTSFQANQVDVYKQDETNSTNPEFYHPAMANAGVSQTEAGAQLFVNPGFYLDSFSTSLYVGNNLNVLGTAINADRTTENIRFDLLNYNVSNLQIGSQADFIDIGQTSVGSIATVRNSLTDLQSVKLSTNDIQSSTGNVAVRLDDEDATIFGKVTIGGTELYAGLAEFTIASAPTRGTLFERAQNITFGADDTGIATFRNNITELTGFLRLGKNEIRTSDDSTTIAVGLGGTYVETFGDLIVEGKNILSGFGVSQISMIEGQKIIFYQDIQVGGNDILSSDGSVNITMFDNQELTSVTGALRVEGGEIQSGGGNTNITMNSSESTVFAGAIQIDGDEIRSSNGQTNIALDGDILTEFKGDIQVGGSGSIKAPDGIIALTVENGTGNVAIASDVSANSAFFNGLEARLNVQDVNIRDNIVELGLIEDPTTEGTLIPPNVGLGNSGDVGFLMARYDIGLSTHKYAGIFYDESAGRIAIRTDVEDANNGEIGRDRKLQLNGLPSELEVKNLLVTLNNTIGVKTLFEPSSSDASVLTLGNVELDAGTY